MVSTRSTGNGNNAGSIAAAAASSPPAAQTTPRRASKRNAAQAADKQPDGGGVAVAVGKGKRPKRASGTTEQEAGPSAQPDLAQCENLPDVPSPSAERLDLKAEGAVPRTPEGNEGGLTELVAGGAEDVARAPDAPQTRMFERMNNTLQVLLHLPQMSKPAATAAVGSSVWAHLIAQYNQIPSKIDITGSQFTIGRSRVCSFQLRDSSLGSCFCRFSIHRSNVAQLENLNGSGILSVNHKVLRKGAKVSLTSGDEIMFSGSKPYSYVSPHDVVSASHSAAVRDDAAAYSSALAPSSPAQHAGSTPLNPATMDATPVSAGMTTLCLASPSDTEAAQDPVRPTSALPGPTRRSSRRALMPEVPELQPVAEPASPTAKTILEQPVASKQAPQEAVMLVGGDTASGETVVGPPSSDVDRVDAADTTADAAAATTKKQQFKAELLKLIVLPENVDVSLDDFPYFLSEATKAQLINSCFIHLKRPDFIKFTHDLPTLSHKILLSGPAGSEIFQETLTRALARHFGAKLLVFDGLSAFLDSDLADTASMPTLSDMAPLVAAPDDMDGNDLAEMTLWGPNDEDAGQRASDRLAELARPSTRDALPNLNSGPSSCCGPLGGSNGRAALGSSRRVLKKGDRVKYVGTGSSAPTGLQSSMHSYFCSLHGVDGTSRKAEAPGMRGPYVGCRGRVVMTFDENPRKVGVRFDRPIPGGTNLGNLCEDSHGFFCNVTDLRAENSAEEDMEKACLETLFEVVSSMSAEGPTVLFIRDVEKTIVSHYEWCMYFRKKLEKLEGQVVSHASSLVKHPLLDSIFLDTLSRPEERVKDQPKASKFLTKLFPNRIVISPPQGDNALEDWKRRLDKDMETLKADANRKSIRKVMTRCGVECDDMALVHIKDQLLTQEAAEKVVGWATTHQLMHDSNPQWRDSKFVVKTSAFEHGVDLLRCTQNEAMSVKTSLKDVNTDNEFEKRLLSEVIPPNEIGVSFDDIGALESVKETLKELVMLPLQRPELFSKGQLTKPCKGILLFGPPGTGKTMLAKAVATEAGANFINISMSTIASKWFGEGEKYVKAVFSLASKIAPSVVFIDEVDSMLGRREKPGEHEAMRKIKNEFMANWDGLRTRDKERVLVLAATNRPFDLDEAVVRRLPRRLMVDLPDVENRIKIIKVILGREELATGFDFTECAQLTDGYSGSDLKNLCMAAAYRPIREILEAEKKAKGTVKDNAAPPVIRPLSMEDMRQAKNQVGCSVSLDAVSMMELRQWNELYGEGGSRKRNTLTYFL
eukprot:jgi/Chlat1/9045/Chrsp94S08357